MDYALSLLPNDHPDRAIHLDSLGEALQARFERNGMRDDFARAIVVKEQAFALTSAPPSVRLKVARSLSRHLVGEDIHRAKSVLQTAVRLLPQISPRALKRGDQQYNISQFADITSRAVSLSLACGEDPLNALQLLELGRGIIANLQLEVRSDISLLSASYPAIGEKFRSLRDQIDSCYVNSTSTLDMDKRLALFHEFETTIASIRRLDGFQTFLLGPTESEIMTLAHHGSIVIFNVSEIRSDAFLVTSNAIRSLHLPLLRSDDLVARAATLPQNC